MDNPLKGAIDVLVKRIEDKTAELNNTKKMVNDLCREAGMDAMYTDADLKSVGGAIALRPDEFYGKSPMSAAREFLEKRGQAATLDEIRDALFRGGFDFVAQKWPENAQKKHLSIGVSKNSKIFHRLPNDMIGLTEWYPNIKGKKASAEKSDLDDTGSDNAEGLNENITDAPPATAGGNKSDVATSFIPTLTEDDLEQAKTANQGT